MTRRRQRTGVGVPSVMAMAMAVAGTVGGCDDITAGAGGGTAFGPPSLVWQWPGGTTGTVVLADAPGGRTFAFMTAPGPDGQPMVYQTEHVGTDWLPPWGLARPAGAQEERVAWVVQGDSPVLATLARGAAGGVVYTREFLSNAWSGPFAATTVGGESVTAARLAVGDGPVHLVYTVSDGSCPGGGGVIRHRRRVASGVWNAAERVTTACGAARVTVAAGGGTADPLMVFWSAPSAGSAGGTDQWGAWSGSGTPVVFQAPQRVPAWQGTAEGASVVATGTGAYLATWLQAGSPRYGVWSAYDPNGGTWTVPDRMWAATAIAPAPVGGGAAVGVLAITTATDVPGSALVVRRWASVGQPQGGSQGLATPLGTVSQPWLRVSTDGSLQAVWVETVGGTDRVLWATTAPAAVPDAGNGTDAGSVTDDVPGATDLGSPADVGADPDAGMDAGTDPDAGMDAGTDPDAGMDAEAGP